MANQEVRCFSTTDRVLLRAFLEPFFHDAAYFLGDLQEPFFSACDWFVASVSGKPRSLLLVYRGLSTPTLLSLGDPDLLECLLQEFGEVLPTNGFAKIPQTHRAVFARYATLSSASQPMCCMGLTADTFVAAPYVETGRVVRRLTLRDSLDRIFAVYEDYPGHFFEPSQLRSGLYYGSFVEQKLCCIAGTHVYSPSERVAVLGNIVTSNWARNQGHARATLSALIKALLKQGCPRIALHVSQANAPAIACYESLGFRFSSALLDAPFEGLSEVPSGLR